MDFRDCVPDHKDDLAATENATRAGYPALADVLGDLLPWIKDPTWAVAGKLIPVLAKAGPEIAPHIMVIFAGQDEDLKQAILLTLAPKLQPAVRALLKPEIERIANSPTDGEAAAGADEAARLVLSAWGS